MQMFHTGGSVVRTGPQDFICPAVISGSYGFSSRAWLGVVGGAAGHSDGIAGYFEGFVAGDPDGHCYGVGAWLSISGGGTVDLGAHAYRALDVGFYDGGALESTSAVITGLHIYTHVLTVTNPAAHYQMSFNTNDSEHKPDAWFDAVNDASVAYTANATHSTASTDKVGAIAVNMPAGLRYIYLYSHAGQ